MRRSFARARPDASAHVPDPDARRVAALRQARLDAPHAIAAFDDIAALAAHVSGLPAAVVTLVDEARFWHASAVGLDAGQGPREFVLCALVVDRNAPLIVPDAARDPTLAAVGCVAEAPHVRAYAGFPIRAAEGLAVGALAVVSTEPYDFPPDVLGMLERLASQLDGIVELRRQATRLDDLSRHLIDAQEIAELGSWEYDFSSGRLEWSDQTLRLFGVERAQFGETFEAFLAHVHPDDRAGFLHDSERVHGEDVSGERHYRITRPDGAERIMLSRGARRVRNAFGQEVLAGTVQDVTDRIALERALEHSARQYRHLFEAHPEPVWVYEVTTRRFLAVNDAAISSYGWTREEFLSMTLDEIRPAETLSAFHAYMAARPVDRQTTHEWLHQRRDGSRLMVQIVAAPLPFAGREARIVVARDVTAMRVAEADARRATELLRTTLEGFDDALITIDDEARITFVNDRAEQLTGRLRQTILQRSIDAAFAPPFATQLLDAATRARQSGETVRFESRTADRRLIDVMASRNSQGVTLHLRDITERRELEERLLRSHRLESIGTLAGGIAHDLNNTLAPIVLASELLRSSAGAGADEALAVIDENARRGAAMVNQLLLFARGSSRDPQPIDLAPIVQEVVRTARHTFLQAITFDVEVHPGLPAVRADATQIQQVLMNLCVNARDAMGARGGRIRITLDRRTLRARELAGEREVPPGEFVRLVVRDNGVGMAPDVLARIFDPFYTTKDVGRGTGLGLSTALSIVRAHGGLMHACSEPGHGAAFEVLLPALVDAAANTPAVAEPPSPGEGETILIVDDEQSIREIVRRTLQRHGYRVLVAERGEDALRLLAAPDTRVDLAITDLMMPGMGGLRLAREIRASHPQLVLLGSTGLGDPERRRAALAEGMVELLEKPYSVAQLLDAVRRGLARGERRERPARHDADAPQLA